MIRIHVYDRQLTRPEWREIPNGPFPLTEEQLMEARRRFQAELAVCPDLSGAKISPQTACRAILKEVVPTLSDFDAAMVGFAVSNDKVRVEEDHDTY